MKILTKRTMLLLLLCFAFSCTTFILFSNASTTVFAQEQTDFHSYSDSVEGLESISINMI